VNRYQSDHRCAETSGIARLMEGADQSGGVGKMGVIS